MCGWLNLLCGVGGCSHLVGLYILPGDLNEWFAKGVAMAMQLLIFAVPC